MVCFKRPSFGTGRGHRSQSRGCQHFRDFSDRRDCLEHRRSLAREGSPSVSSIQPQKDRRLRCRRDSSRRDSHVRGQQEDAELGLRYDRGLVSALAIDGDGKTKLPEHSRSVSRPFEADEFQTSSSDRHGWIRILPEGHPSLLRPACLYGQVLKTPRNDHIIKVERRALHGAAWRFEDALNNSEDSSTLNTSFIERLNLTIRQSSAYLSRRTLSHARSTERLDEHLELLRCYYNFVRPHGALKFGREIRTPAMQAGLTTRRLTFRDIFLATTIPLWSQIDVFLLTGARNSVSSAPVPLPAAA